MPEVILNHNGEAVRYALDKEILNIGRSKDNDIILENLSVSRNHARIRLENNQYILIDLNSANGTLVNGRKVNKIAVQNGDIITVGKHEFRFVDEELSEGPGALSKTGLHDELDRPLEPSRNLVLPLLLITKGRKQWEFNLIKPETSIGKGKTNDIPLPDLFASKRHALIIRQDKEFFIRDLGSWRGTILNDHPVQEEDGPQALHEGDVIKIGACELKFTFERDQAGADAQVQPPFTTDKTPVMTPLQAAGDAPAAEGEELSEEMIVFSDGDEFHTEEAEAPEAGDEQQQFVREFAAGAEKVHDATDPIRFPPAAEQIPADEHEEVDLEAAFLDHDHTDPLETPLVGAEDADEQLVLADTDSSEFASAEFEAEGELEEIDLGGETAPIAPPRAEEPPSVENVMALYGEETPRSQAAKPPAKPPAKPARKQEPAAAARKAESAVPQPPANDLPPELPVEETCPPESEKSIDLAQQQALSSPESSPKNAKLEREIKMWLKALENNSALIRSEAKRRLKELTGQDYD